MVVEKDVWIAKLPYYQQKENEKSRRFLEMMRKGPDDYSVFSEMADFQESLADALDLTLKVYKKKIKSPDAREILKIVHESWKEEEMITWGQAEEKLVDIEAEWNDRIHEPGVIMDKRSKYPDDVKYLRKLDKPRKRRKKPDPHRPQNIARLKAKVANKEAKEARRKNLKVLGKSKTDELYQARFEDETARQTKATPIDELPVGFWDK